jgi:hypothetical protein
MTKRWFRGNLHTHTTVSDGDASPKEVAGWYLEHGYDFLSLTDHNALTAPSLAALPGLVLIPGEEITMALDVHVNGLGLWHVIPPASPRPSATGLEARRGLVEQAVGAVRAQGGLASVNHPNFRWALDFEVLAAAPGFQLLEVFNGHPEVNNEGRRGQDGAERLWDRLLSAGRRVWGLATDDAHRYHDFAPIYANPGRGWVYVRAEQCRPDLLLEALASGDFYASTGVKLADYTASSNAMDVAVEGPAGDAASVELIGRDGEVLDAQTGSCAAFRLPAARGYVRARITLADGSRAWLQPVFSPA